MAAAASVDLDRWQAELGEVMLRIGPRFARREPRAQARAFVVGLLAGLPQVTCWSIAEHAGHTRPDGLQHLLADAAWDADGVRDDLRSYVVEHLGAPDGVAGRDVVLVADETGDLKKGGATVGVARQYSGTAGRVDNAQVAVYLVYAGPRGQAFIARELSLPRAGADDPERMRAAGVPADVVVATKPALAAAMVDRALDAGVAAGWFTADEVYGADPTLPARWRGRGLGYVVAVARDHRVATGIGTRRAVELAVRADLVWQRVSAGDGAQGRRYYDWAQLGLADTDRDQDRHGGQHILRIRRAIRSGQLAFYRTWTPTPVPLATLVRVAGRRWTVEESFQAGTSLAGLDAHQVRRPTS